ncbi:MAG TPA: MoaD/ThiS family protein [Candidatus Acidoferrales bacterium]|jgi:sulfur carrier protein ThiS|nr:MoaD/ThiS family protein [Candidatus Acidoferrales bacterium]
MPKETLCVTVEFNGESQTVYLPTNSDYEGLLGQLNLNPEKFLVFADGNSIPLDEQVRPGIVRLLKVVSGG